MKPPTGKRGSPAEQIVRSPDSIYLPMQRGYTYYGMNPEIQQPGEKYHSCDAALQIMLSPASADRVLHLADNQQDGTALQWTVADGMAPDGASVSAADRDAIQPRCTGRTHPGDFSLPFPDAAFERVVLTIRHAWPHAVDQKRALGREIGRVLAPGGQLLLLARPRHNHARRKNRTISARFAAAFQVAWWSAINWQRFPGKRAIARFLADAGFSEQEWFRPLREGGGRLCEVKPISVRATWWQQRSGEHGNAGSRLIRWLPNEFAVRASPAAPRLSTLECCLSNLVERLQCHGDSAAQIRVERFLVTAKEKAVVLVRAGDKEVVVRIPLSVAAADRCRHNIAMLETLSQDRDRDGIAPLPLARERHDHGCGYTAESRVEGVPVALAEDRDAQLDWAQTLLRCLNPESRLRHARLAGDLYERLVTEPLDRVLRLEQDRNLCDRVRALLDHHLHDRTVALGLRHGDFSLGNIHVQGGRVTGLIDWDDSDPDAIAMEDAISHLSSRIVRRADSFPETFLGLATREALDAKESAFLDRCYVYYGMDPRMHPGLVLLFWAHAIDAQLDFAFAREHSYRTSRINRVLELFTDDARLR